MFAGEWPRLLDRIVGERMRSRGWTGWMGWRFRFLGFGTQVWGPSCRPRFLGTELSTEVIWDRAFDRGYLGPSCRPRLSGTELSTEVIWDRAVDRGYLGPSCRPRLSGTELSTELFGGRGDGSHARRGNGRAVGNGPSRGSENASLLSPVEIERTREGADGVDATRSGLMGGREFTQGSPRATLGWRTQPRWGKGAKGDAGTSGVARGSQALGSGKDERRCHSGEWRAQGAREG